MEDIKFGDIELAVIDYLKTQLKTTAVGSELPDKRPSTYVTVRRGGGPRRDMVTDSAQLNIECWAATRSAAFALAADVRSKVNALAGTTLDGLTVYRVIEFSGPAYMRHPIHQEHRYVFSVQADVRAQH